jgi:hypothetical protein
MTMAKNVKRLSIFNTLGTLKINLSTLTTKIPVPLLGIKTTKPGQLTQSPTL